MIIALVACCTTAFLTAHLSVTNFLLQLNSDHLYPHMFAKDLLFGAYPIDAWKFGSATFLFPDYFIYAPLLLIFGDSGVTFPIFAVSNMLLLGLAISFAIRRIAQQTWPNAIAVGYGTVAAVLSFQFIPGQGFALYWLLLPGFHGSSQTLGIFLMTLLIGDYRQRARIAPAVIGVGTLGVFSNTLLLTQYLLPWLTLAGVLAYFANGNAAAFKRHAYMIGSIIAGILLLRLTLWLLNFWEFAAVFRHAPYPSAIWQCLLGFVSDFGADTGPRLWVYWALFAVLIASVSLRKFRTQFSCFAALGVVSGIILPVIAVYWKDFNNSRYFLNLLLLPAVALVITFLGTPQARLRAVRSISTAGLLILLAASAFFVARDFKKPEAFRFHYPEQVAEFDRLVEENQLSLGLSNYWQSHLYNQLSKVDVYLNHVRADGSPYYWCNNVYWYYGDPDSSSGSATTFPEYDFVLVNELDEDAIRAAYGEPDSVVEGKYNRILVYKDQANRIRQAIKPSIAAWLEGKTLSIAQP